MVRRAVLVLVGAFLASSGFAENHPGVPPAVSFANPQDGRTFLALCEAWDAARTRHLKDADMVAGALCYSYVQGFVDAASAYEGVQRLAQQALGVKNQAHMACYVPGTQYPEYVRAVLRYLHAHPSEVRTKTRDELTMDALAEAYPCKGAK